MVTIFLDIDGVLATNKEFNMNSRKFREKNEWANELCVFYPFNAGCVDVLNKVLESCECEIVLSSDWRKYYSIPELADIFMHNGVVKSPVAVTDDIMIRHLRHVTDARRKEIMIYVEGNAVDKWIVIDDIYVGENIGDEFRDRCFRTTDSEGLKITSLCDKIINKMKELECQ